MHCSSLLFRREKKVNGKAWKGTQRRHRDGVIIDRAWKRLKRKAGEREA